VTYSYIVTSGAGQVVEVVDDKLGLIGRVASSGTLSQTTTLTETTTNTAVVSGITCFCFVGDLTDTVTVTVATPTPCEELWPVVEITTLGKSQSPSNNPKVVNFISGNIIDPSSLGDSAHRIPVCSGTRVDVSVTDTTGTPTVTANSSGISCIGSTCVVETITEKEKYIARSSDAKDTDRITLLPQ
jgi:hypothetical protein